MDVVLAAPMHTFTFLLFFFRLCVCFVYVYACEIVFVLFGFYFMNLDSDWVSIFVRFKKQFDFIWSTK